MAERHRTCEICGIREKTLSEKRFFARFPLDKNRCADWLKVVGKEDLAYLPVHKLHDLKYICEIHFTKQDLTKSRTRLKKNSVPKLHLTLAQLSDDIIAEFLRLNSHLSEQSVHAGAASTAVEQQPAATSQSTSDLEISSVNLKSASTASAVSTAVEEDPTASTSQSASVLGISPVNVQSLTQQAVPALPASDEPVASTSGGTKRKLDDNIVNVQSVRQQAVPALPASDEPVASTSGGTKRKLDDNIYATPRKRKLLMQLRKTKCTLASLKKSATLVENLSSTVLKDFVLSALQNQKRKPQGKRWTLRNKISALAILKRSPKAYRYMQHMMPLPSIKTLQNILKKMPMEPGINPAVISHLKKIANNFKHKDKLCTLAFDEMALKERLTYNMATDKVEGFVDTGIERKGELANHALVFMLQGVGKKIKQPLAFYFVKGTISTEKLAVLVKDTIKEINSTGFNIIATICDQGPTNLGALRLLKEWHKGEDNYFEMDNKKVFFIFDVPHLFKSIRNNFLKQGGIKMEERIGKWSHIMEVEEQNRGFLYLSKITPTHVQPKYRAKMRVKYAVQILSQTVAVVLKLLAKCVENQHRSDEILQTALIVEDLNKLFDYTNGPSSPNDIKKGIRENVSAKSNHVRVWSEFRHKLSTLKFVGENGADAKNVRCIEGYIITLKSLADIWNLVKNTGYKHLNLRQLNQDALENLFGIIRQHSPTNNHPTCSTFIAALKTTVISGMTAPHSRGFNCEKDDKLLLTNFHEVIFDKTEETTHEDNEEISIEVVNDPPVLSLPDNLEDMELEADLTQIKEQPLVYISGYIAARIMKKSQCIDCKNSLTVNDPMDNPLYELIKLKEWWQDKQSLTYPSLNLCRVVEKAIKTFETEGIPNFHYIDICQWIVTLIHTNCNTEWLQCNAHAEKITHEVYSKLALLLVRRQCQRVNLSKASKEEDLADANKKGQQYGVAK